MLRAQFKDQHYFDQRIEFREYAIDYGLKKLRDDKTLTTEIKMCYAIDLFSDHLGLLELKYSRGDAILPMKTVLLQAMQCRRLQKIFADQLPAKEQYARVQWEHIGTGRLRDIYQWLLFALSVGMEPAYFEEALGLINLRGRDHLFDAIAVKLGDEREITAKQWDKRTFGGLITIINSEPAQRAARMNKYLERWYNIYGLKDLHINTEEGYWGYWCFEAALVSRLWQMDDSGWRDHPYYPKDLVHPFE